MIVFNGPTSLDNLSANQHAVQHRIEKQQLVAEEDSEIMAPFGRVSLYIFAVRVNNTNK